MEDDEKFHESVRRSELGTRVMQLLTSYCSPVDVAAIISLAHDPDAQYQELRKRRPELAPFVPRRMSTPGAFGACSCCATAVQVAPHDKTWPPSDIDEPCIRICEAINALDGLETFESCCGHGGAFVIYFHARQVSQLLALASDVSWRAGWSVCVSDTDVEPYVTFALTGPRFVEGLAGANQLAAELDRVRAGPVIPSYYSRVSSTSPTPFVGLAGRVADAISAVDGLRARSMRTRGDVGSGFEIWFDARDVRCLYVVARAVDRRYCGPGEPPWCIEALPDPPSVMFLLRSPTVSVADVTEGALRIALNIYEFLCNDTLCEAFCIRRKRRLGDEEECDQSSPK